LNSTLKKTITDVGDGQEKNNAGRRLSRRKVERNVELEKQRKRKQRINKAQNQRLIVWMISKGDRPEP
jgi:hypothetical protein